MRLWSLHPRYLDRQGLVACWREGLLAQRVLVRPGRGYTNHPQLHRFRAQPEPVAAIGRYLAGLADEADQRGYRFDRGRIEQRPGTVARIPVTRGQLDHERRHLAAKLADRNPDRAVLLPAVPSPHPSFVVVAGPVEDWERTPR